MTFDLSFGHAGRVLYQFFSRFAGQVDSARGCARQQQHNEASPPNDLVPSPEADSEQDSAEENAEYWDVVKREVKMRGIDRHGAPFGNPSELKVASGDEGAVKDE